VFFDGDALVNVTGSEVPDWANTEDTDAQVNPESEEEEEV